MSHVEILQICLTSATLFKLQPTSKGANANIDMFNKKTHLAGKQLNSLSNEGVQGRYLRRKSAFLTYFYMLVSFLNPK